MSDSTKHLPCITLARPPQFCMCVLNKSETDPMFFEELNCNLWVNCIQSHVQSCVFAGDNPETSKKVSRSCCITFSSIFAKTHSYWHCSALEKYFGDMNVADQLQELWEPRQGFPVLGFTLLSINFGASIRDTRRNAALVSGPPWHSKNGRACFYCSCFVHYLPFDHTMNTDGNFVESWSLRPSTSDSCWHHEQDQ